VRVGKTGVLGSFEELVLLAVVHNGDDAYSVTIRRHLASRTGSDVAMGSVYATLDRLEGKGLVDSAVEEGSSSVGRPRRYYRVSPEGLKALAETRAIRDAMWHGVRIAPTGEADA
jgi:PadR family transcriptional regulator PadR